MAFHLAIMAWIALEGMRFHARHGVYPAERVIGNEYIVDIRIRTGIAKASAKDDLAETINYETVYQVCALEMSQPRQLIETVVSSIIKRLKHQFDTIMEIKIKIRKLNPPLGGRLDCSSVEDEVDLTKSCPRCKGKFLCYGDETCWCKSLTNIHPATLETLKRQFGSSCLCGNCLKLYAG